MHILFSVQETISEEFTMDEDSADPSIPPLSCSTEPNPPESLVPDSNHRDIDNCSEIPRFNIVVKEEEDWDNTVERGASSNTSSSDGAPTEPEQHQENPRPKKFWRCPECGIEIAHPSNFNRHLRTHTNLAKESSVCPICGKDFVHPSKLKRHFRTHTGEKPYQCSVCGKRFTLQPHLERHQMTHPGEKQPDATKKHPCSDCGKECFSAYELKMHMRKHTGERPHQCSYCEMSFGCKGTLSRHVRRHTGAPTPKPYQCSQCGKRYESPSRLRQHQTVHTGDKPYECSDCGRGFASTEGLRKRQCNHASNHSNQCTLGIPDMASSGSKTMNIKIEDEEQELAINVKEEEIVVFVNADGKKPYRCTSCKNTFVHRSSLARHKQSHTSVAQYSCSECGKEFSQSWTFKIHMQQHTGENPYHCCRCDKSFSASPLLKRHQRVHTKVKPYPCSLCRNKLSSANQSCLHAGEGPVASLSQAPGQGSQQQVSAVVEESVVLDVKEEEEDPAFGE
uniref:C2H2-type domain-containing protein n=1 Tax=Oncorhynchus mykiss TaxID=8022 RepID=A0A8K9VDI8_ONCMY